MSEYYYLVSSLPLLDLGSAPDIDSDEFLDSCSAFLPTNEMQELASLSLTLSEGKGKNKAVSEWYSWEVKLRNTILLKRTEADIEDPEKFLREEDDFFCEIQKGVQEAFSKSPQEREEHIDMVRWGKLEDLELGHDFDFTRLCLYKLQLLLCEKRKDRNKEKGSMNYDEVVSEIYGVDPLAPPQIEENTDNN